MIRIELPGMRLVSLTNAREHHMARARRAKSQRHAAWALTIRGIDWAGETVSSTRRRLLYGAVAIITRKAPRRLDSDNLAASAKHVRDGVADALGIDDGDPRITWLYAQEKGPYGVRIEFRQRIELQSTSQAGRVLELNELLDTGKIDRETWMKMLEMPSEKAICNEEQPARRARVKGKGTGT